MKAVLLYSSLRAGPVGVRIDMEALTSMEEIASVIDRLGGVFPDAICLDQRTDQRLHEGEDFLVERRVGGSPNFAAATIVVVRYVRRSVYLTLTGTVETVLLTRAAPATQKEAA